MARRPFGGGIPDWVFADGTAHVATIAGAATVTFWTARTGGSQITDLASAADGTGPITSVTSSNGSDTYALGAIPVFYGPDNVFGMWASANGGPRSLMLATDLPDRITAIEAGNSTVQKVEVAKAGTLVGTRKRLNLIQGSNVALTVADNSGSDRVDVTIAATATIFNVRDYGALGDGTTDDTTAIAAAVTAATPATISAAAGTVFFPAGVYVTAPIVVPQRVGLQGIGFGSTIQLKDNAGTLVNLITNRQNYSGVNDAQGITVRDLRLDGNNGSQLANSWNCGIVLNNDSPSGSFEYVDGRHQVSNVLIEYFTGDGFVQAGGGASQVSDVQVWNCDGFGFNIAIDSEYTGCDAGACGLDGWLIQGNNLLTGCKSWFSGDRLTSGRATGTAQTVTPPANAWDGGGIAGLTFSLANGFGNGFLFRDISGSSDAGNFNGGIVDGCNAQDNARAGFYVRGGRQTITGCEADSNGNNGTSTGLSTGTPVGRYAGFDVDASSSNNTIIGTSWDREANVNHQAAALSIGSGATGNRVQLTFRGTLNDASTMPPLLAGSVIGNNLVQLRCMGGGVNAASYSATYTPDPFVAELHTMTLTGNVTINNPALDGASANNVGPGIFLLSGMRLVIQLTQDATGGRTVTLGAAFKLNGFTFNTTASTTSTVTFVWDGTNWQAINGGKAGKSPDIQTFTSSGTWTRPAGAVSVGTMMIGGAGGGGSGRRGAAGSVRCGGGGGGGGGMSIATFPASLLTSTVTVTIGAGGSAGAAISANDTNGNNGGDATATLFGTYARTGGAGGGVGGTALAGTGGYAGLGNMGYASAGADASATGGAGGASSQNAQGGTGGGAGGGITSGNTAGAGGAAGASTVGTGSGANGGVVGGASPQAGSSTTAGLAVPGSGGGGGAASTSGAGQAGAAGGSYGGGGGGGGASVNGSNSGAGAAGSAGILVVTTYF